MKLEAAQTAGSSGIEIHGVEPGSHRAWSVLVTGRVEAVYEPADVSRLEGLGIRTWLGAAEPFWVRVRADDISGRELVLPT